MYRQGKDGLEGLNQHKSLVVTAKLESWGNLNPYRAKPFCIPPKICLEGLALMLLQGELGRPGRLVLCQGAEGQCRLSLGGTLLPLLGTHSRALPCSAGAQEQLQQDSAAGRGGMSWVSRGLP